MEAANRAMRSSGDLLADRRYGFAMALAERGDREGAADLLAQAVDIAPQFASAWFALGELREAMGDPAGACDAFARAQAADPESGGSKDLSARMADTARLRHPIRPSACRARYADRRAESSAHSTQ